MIIIASIWLGLALLLCAFAWWANRPLSASFLPLGVIIVGFCLWSVSGTPRLTHPPAGHYSVLGVKLVPDVGIWVLLDGGSGDPVYYRLPWSTKAGNEIQDALNQGNGKGVTANFTGEPGGESYDGPPPVTADETKTPETPEYSF
jgi:hypothetical protein